MIGVNGSGKTTTIGKLAAQVRGRGAKGDARGRRHVPGRRDRADQDLGLPHQAKVFAREQGSDAASLAFEALTAAPKAEAADVLIVDTAGRLQNRAELMDELGKIVRVIKKVDASPRRMRCCWCWMRPSARTRCRRSRCSANIAGVTGLDHDQARRHRAGAAFWSPSPPSTACPCTSSGSARGWMISLRSRRVNSRAPLPGSSDQLRARTK